MKLSNLSKAKVLADDRREQEARLRSVERTASDLVGNDGQRGVDAVVQTALVAAMTADIALTIAELDRALADLGVEVD